MNHLAEEDLLLLATGELEPEEAAAARRHLEVCAECARRRDDLEEFRDNLSREIIGHSLKELSGKFADVEARRGWRSYARLAATVAASCVVIIGAAFWFTRPTPLSAKEVLSMALAAEQQLPPKTTAVRIRSARRGCSVTRNAKKWLERASVAGCESFTQAVEHVAWNWDDPISVRSFSRWRDGLESKSDTVVDGADGVRLETHTESGPLAFAALTLAHSNYTPIELQLGVAGFDTLTLTPEAVEAPPQIAALPSPIPQAIVPPVAPLEHPGIDLEKRAADEHEVAVREALYGVGADRGFETIVLRQGNDVTVLGLVATAERRAELENALRPIRGVQSRISLFGESTSGEFLTHLPPRNSAGAGPALLEARLKTLLGSGERIQHLKNEVLGESQQILGLARVSEELRQRINELASCPCSARLNAIVQHHAEELHQHAVNLARALAVITGENEPARTITLSASDAQRLDTALIKLFDASNDGDNAEQELAVVVAFLQ